MQKQSAFQALEIQIGDKNIVFLTPKIEEGNKWVDLASRQAFLASLKPYKLSPFPVSTDVGTEIVSEVRNYLPTLEGGVTSAIVFQELPGRDDGSWGAMHVISVDSPHPIKIHYDGTLPFLLEKGRAVVLSKNA